MRWPDELSLQFNSIPETIYCANFLWTHATQPCCLSGTLTRREQAGALLSPQLQLVGCKLVRCKCLSPSMCWTSADRKNREVAVPSDGIRVLHDQGWQLLT